MQHPTRLCAVLTVLALVPTAARAQEVGIGVAAHLGTLGIGADVAVSVHPNIGFRAGGNIFPFGISIESSDVDYDLSLPSPQFLLLADLYPAGAFRFSGGLMISSSDFELEAKLAEPVEIGGTTYTPAQVGSLTGTFGTRTVSPYLGIGFGNPARTRLGFFFDLGVAFHGTPEVSAVASGPVALLPGFQQDLDAEVAEIQDDVDEWKFYPVLSVGIAFGLGR